MKVSYFRRYSFFILLSTVFAVACNNAPAEEEKKSENPPSSISTDVPPPAAYVADKEGWLVDLDEAYAESFATKKPILANFTGSDWCGWCKRLDADVFSKPLFKEWAAENVILLEVDFPRRKQLPEKNKRQNAAMAQSLGVRGYPTIWMLGVSREEENSRFKVQPIGKTGYTKTPEEFIGVLDNYIRLSKKGTI